jgi:hypothetical protein
MAEVPHQSYTDAQLDGYACIECGERGGVMFAAGYGPRGQLFQHDTCPSPAHRSDERPCAELEQPELVVIRAALLEVDTRARLNGEYVEHPDSLLPKVMRKLDAELEARDG